MIAPTGLASRLARRGLLVSGALALAACGSSKDSALLSNEPIQVRPASTPAPPSLPAVRLPEDEAPHDVLAEWWYYTGHLYTQQEQEYGFELVFFRGVRGNRSPGYAAHFAVSDVAKQRFAFDQRQDVALTESRVPAALAPPEGGPAARPAGVVSVGPRSGFDLAMGGWSMRGRDGRDHLSASMANYSLELDLAALRPPALHLGAPAVGSTHSGVPTDRPGLLSFGPAGYSYYYSRTRMAASGTLNVEGTAHPVHGEAWMDRQWGDFLVLGGGGWDWFAGNLRDGRDVTVSVIRDASGAPLIAYGTLVQPDAEPVHLPSAGIDITASGTWTSPRTGVRYPAGWRLRVPAHRLDLEWVPLLADQELDARASSGVIYWEGAVRLADPMGNDVGRGYVELTGYTVPK